MDTEELKTNSQKECLDNFAMLEEIILSECSPIIKKYNIDDKAIREIITKAIVPAQEFTRKLWQLYNDTMSNCPDIFQVIDAELFLRIIKHIRSVVYQKIENRNVGISIVIYSKEDDIGNANSDYNLQASILRDKEIKDTKDYFDDPHNELKRAYKGIDSHKAFFAFVYNKITKTIIFKGIRTFNSGSIEQICIDNQVGFNVSEGVPCIRIYTKGNHILDYIINESTGDWVIRIKENIKEIIGKQLILNHKDLGIITEIVLQLSYLRIGAMLIITSEQDYFKNSSSTHDLKSFYLEEDFHSGLIYQYAANDGAVIIQYEQGKRLKTYKIGVILNPAGDMYDKSTYKALVENNTCGSRHEKAARYACEHPNDCIIVVSENRSISILHGPEPIYWRDDSNPLKK